MARSPRPFLFKKLWRRLFPRRIVYKPYGAGFTVLEQAIRDTRCDVCGAKLGWHGVLRVAELEMALEFYAGSKNRKVLVTEKRRGLKVLAVDDGRKAREALERK